MVRLKKLYEVAVTELCLLLLLFVFTKSWIKHYSAGKDNLYHDVNDMPRKNKHVFIVWSSKTVTFFVW